MAEKNMLGNLFGSFVDNLKLVVKQLDGDDTSRPQKEDFDRNAFWLKLATTVQAVSAEATKLSMIFSKAPAPAVEYCEQMISRVEGATLSLVSAFYCLPKSQGLSLRRSTLRAVLEVVEAVKTLAETISTEALGSQSQLRFTGCVWQYSDCFASLPRDNREAVLHRLENTSGLVKDASDELQEAVDSGLQDDFSDPLDDDNDDDDDKGTDMDTASGWSDGDKAVVSTCMGLVKVCRSVLKKTTAAVKTSGQCDTHANISQLDELADHSDRLSPTVDDLALALYPPVRHTVVEENAQKLGHQLKTFLEFLRQTHVTTESDAQWLEFLLSATQHNLEKIDGAINNR